MAIKEGSRTSNENLSAEQKKQIKAQETAREKRNKKILSDVSLRPGMGATKKVAIGTAVTAVGIASALVPAKFVVDNMRYEMTMHVEGVRYDSYSITAKRGTKISALEHYEITGYSFKGFYKNAACTEPYLDSDKVTANAVVYCKYEPISYKVTYPEDQNGYKIITAPTEVEYEQDLTFTLAVLDKYNKSEVKVYVNGNLIESDDGIYTVKNVKSDLNITVKGIEENYYDFTVTVNGQICKLHTNKLQLSKAELFDVDAFINGSWSTIRDYLIETSMSENETYYSTTGITKENLLLLSNEDLLNVISTGTFDEMFVSAADKYGNGVDVSGFVVEDDLEVKLETEYATLNKLSFASNAVFASSTEISGEVLMPTKYLEKNAKDEFKLKNLTKLNNGAFADCSKITSVKIGRTITKITRNPFSNCERLTKIQVDENNTAFTSENNCVIENINGIKTLRLGCGTSVIPEDVVVIGESAFEGCANLTDIVVPSSVDTISKNAFKGCVNLKTVTLPLRQDVVNGELEILGIKVFEGAFAGCVNAQTLNLGSEIETTDTKIFSDFGKNYGFTLNVGEGFKVVKAEAFANLTNLTKVDFNEGLEYINANAFAGCANLQEINLPDSLKGIGEKAFDGCNNVVRLSIGSSLENIGTSAFSGLTKLQRLEYGGNISTNPEGMFASIGTESDICTVEISSSVRYINPKLFQNCTGITNLVLSDGVKSIGDYSFAGCSNLKEIKFGNSLESIENNAFEGCISLTNFVLPDTVVTIQENAFKDCKSLTEVTIPKAVKTLSGTAFAGCSNVSTINCNVNNSTFTGDVFANLGTVVGKGLKLYFNNEGKIRDNFFSNNEIITEVELGENVDSIGRQSFANCTSLKKIQLNEKITEIGTEAFAGCTSLIEITIPGSVKSIGAKAFGGCTALKTAEIQASLDEKVTDEQGKYNGQQMFFNCTSLQDVQFTGTARFVPTEAFEGCSRLTDVGLTGKIKYIREGAFKNCSSITSIHIPDSVENIESKAFSGCLKLTALNNLEKTKITKLNDLVFAGCSNLKTINLPTRLTEIGVQTFSGCSGLLSVKLEGVETIGNAAFSSCTSLTEIDIPDSVTSLGNLAFDGCSNIKSVKLGTRLTYLFAETFGGCGELENLEYNANYDKNSINLGVVFPYLKNIVVGENVTAIRDNEFNKSTTISGASVKTTTKQVGNISSVTLGSKVKTIGTKAFAGTSITSINLNQVATINARAFYGSSLESINLGTVVTTLGESVFENCERLNSVIMGSSIETIPSKAFANTSIYRVDLPSNIIEIAEDAFGTSVIELKYNSTINEGKEYTLKDIFTNLESVEVGGNVSVIRDNEFRDLVKLRSLKLNSGLTEIGFAAFYNAFSKDSSVSVSLALPETATTIGEWAFGYNEGLKKVNLANVTDIKDNAFYNTSLSELIVPDSVKTIGKGAFGDIRALTKVTLGSGLESIYDVSFTFDYKGEVGTNAITELAYNSHVEVKLSEEVLTKNTRNVVTTKTLINAFPGVTKVTIGNNVTTIKDNEFKNSKISNLTLGTGITTIGYAAFENSKIKEVEISNSVESIGGQAFAGTTTLKKVVIHGCDKDISLGEGVFAGCNNLTNAELYNVKTVSDKLFQGCSTLTYLVMNEVETVGNYAFEGTSLKIVELSAKTIGSHAFKDCEKLTYLTINDVESIGVSAFQNCRTLKSIELPSTLKQIGSEAFKDCNAIELLQSEANLESVGNNVFENLGSSTLGVTLRIGNMVEEVKEYTYSSLSNVKEMAIGENVKKLSSFAFGDAVKDVQKLTFNAISAQIVPDGTNNIFAHLGENVSKNLVVEIGESVQSIPNDIFSGCLKLTDITIPESVTTIGDYAFDEAGLKGIQFRGISSLTSVGDSAFMNSKLERFELPKSVNSIGVSAFRGVSSLYEFVFKGNLVTEIKESTFENCANLKAIELKNENTFVRQSAFKNSGLETINGTHITGEIGEEAFYNSKLTGFEIGASVNSIGDRCFKLCTKLTNFKISEGLQSIGEEVFRGCNNLKKVGIDLRKNEISLQNVTSIGSSAFYYCSKLVGKLVLSDNLTVLKLGTFAACSSITDIDLGGVQSIDEGAFVRCNGVFSGIESEKVKIVGYSAFKDCYNVTEISFTNLESVEDNAFQNCRSLTSIDLPSSVEYLGKDSFKDCTNITSLTYNSNMNIGEQEEGIHNYRLKDVFKYLTSVTVGDNITQIRNNEFAGDLESSYGLTVITLGENVESIGDHAFYNNNSIEELTVSDKVSTIGESAFANCSSLNKITLGKAVEIIKKDAFNGISKDRDVYFSTDYPEFARINFENLESNPLCANTGYYNENKIEYNANLWYVGYILTEVFWSNDFSQYAFQGYKKLKRLEFNQADTIIVKEGSFKNCSGLTYVWNANASIKEITIESEAFANINCESFDISGGEIDINENAFNNSAISNLTLSNSGDLYIHRAAFSGVETAINKISYSVSPYVYKEKDKSGNVIISKDEFDNIIDNELRWKDVLKGDSTQDSVSWDCKLQEVVCNVQEVRDNEFAEITTITEVTLNNVKTIDVSSFVKGHKETDGENVIEEACYGVEILNLNVGNDFNVKGVSYEGNKPLRLRDVFGYKKGAGVKNNHSSLKTVNMWMGRNILDNEFAEITTLEVFTSLLNENMDGFESIGANAFNGCGKLEKIVLDTAYLTTIGEDAFKGCGGDRYVVLTTNGSVEKFATGISFANKNSNPLTSSYRNNYNESTKEEHYSDPDNNYLYVTDWLYLPNVDDCIKDSTLIEDVNLLGTDISQYAFQGYKNLTSVTFTSFQGLKEGSFAGCIGLTTVNLGTGSGDIGANAFNNCTSLASISLPNGLINIGDNAFNNCGSDKYSKGLANITIPNSVTSIGANAFKDCTKLTSVSIPNSVTSLGDNGKYTVFGGCSALTTVTLGSGIKQLNINEFNAMNRINSQIKTFAYNNHFEFVDTVQNVTGQDKIYAYDGKEFTGNLVCYTLRDKNNELGENFWVAERSASEVERLKQYTDRIEYLYLDESNILKPLYKVDGMRAFYNPNTEEFEVCLELEKTVDGEDFYTYYLNPISSNSVVMQKDTSAKEIISLRIGKVFTGVTNVTIGASEIRPYEFDQHKSLQTLTMSPDEIGAYAFNKCENLTTLTTDYGTSVITSDNYMYYGFTIGERAFYECTSLQISKIKATEIGAYAFYGCSAITKLDLDVSTIMESEDSEYYISDTHPGVSLRPVRFVGKVEDFAFANLSNLKWLTFNVGEMGSFVFAETKALKGAYMKGGYLGVSAFDINGTWENSKYTGRMRSDSVLYIDADRFTAIDYGSISGFYAIKFLSTNSKDYKLAAYGYENRYGYDKNNYSLPEKVIEISAEYRNVTTNDKVYYVKYYPISTVKIYKTGTFAQYFDPTKEDRSAYFTKALHRTLTKEYKTLNWGGLNVLNDGYWPTKAYVDESINFANNSEVWLDERTGDSEYYNIFYDPSLGSMFPSDYEMNYPNGYALINYNFNGPMYIPTLMF